jgi:hypothetical protein
VKAIFGRVAVRVFGIPFREATFARRGFYSAHDSIRRRLESIGRTFLFGYHVALRTDDCGRLEARLQRVVRERQGFAFEGAAMALALKDRLSPWRQRRLERFLTGVAAPHAYMVQVGVGWALARMPGSIERTLASLDPVLGWLALDGYGFHEGFFDWRRYLAGRPHPRRLSGYARRAFDQGFGRSLWFVDGADVRRISTTIGSFSPERRADLWSGVGLAATYAGGSDREGLASLRQAAGAFSVNVAQGAAFAAKARQRAGNTTSYTDLACEILCAMPAVAAARVTDEMLRDLPVNDGPKPAYELWRQRIQAQFAGTKVGG